MEVVHWARCCKGVRCTINFPLFPLELMRILKKYGSSKQLAIVSCIQVKYSGRKTLDVNQDQPSVPLGVWLLVICTEAGADIQLSIQVAFNFYRAVNII